MTLEDLSTEFGVSRERIRQIEVRAFEKVQKAVQGSARSEEREPAQDFATSTIISNQRVGPKVRRVFL